MRGHLRAHGRGGVRDGAQLDHALVPELRLHLDNLRVERVVVVVGLEELEREVPRDGHAMQRLPVKLRLQRRRGRKTSRLDAQRGRRREPARSAASVRAVHAVPPSPPRVAKVVRRDRRHGEPSSPVGVASPVVRRRETTPRGTPVRRVRVHAQSPRRHVHVHAPSPPHPPRRPGSAGTAR
eukprot:17096-Pelagococcus_subviridis.AAC.1